MWTMVSIVKYTATAVLFSGLALAETWNGIVVDVMCKAKDVAGHTRQCALSPRCSGSGFGLVMADGKFVKFDEAGSSKALNALKASTKETDLRAKVTGTLKGETIQVDSIELQ
jgi:hypothetical protein